MMCDATQKSNKDLHHRYFLSVASKRFSSAAKFPFTPPVKMSFSLALLLRIFLLLYTVSSGSLQKADLRQLFQNYPRNQELIANLGTGYEVVYPIQIRPNRFQGLSTRQMPPKNTMSHVSSTSFVVEALHFKIYLDLELNINLLPPTLTQFLVSSSSRQLITQPTENCYYHATVRNHSDSVGAFRTCNGISGILYFENKVYLIHPLHGDHSSSQPHLLFHHYQSNEENFSCGNDDGDEKLHCWQEHLRATDHRVDIPPGKKYMELALILDQAFFEMHNSPPEEVIANAIQLINCADLHYRPLNTSISLVYIELWTEDIIPIEPSVDQNLDNIEQYLSRYYERMSIDVIHMLSGATFNNSHIGGAKTDSICTTNAVGITKVENIYKPHVTTRIVTHMLGHNLGMDHDHSCCNCSYETGCHMSSDIQSAQSFHFSSCSIEDYFRTLRKGFGVCLFNMPMLRESICGNGILEKGEQCDCGTLEDCKNSDSCCDHITCKFVKNAQCSSGPCCDKCKLKSSTFVCRLAKGECDIPEYCDGIDGQCPLDLFKKNGILCADGLWYCYQGNCHITGNQCKQLWGNGSENADPVCYKKLNVQGTPNGNCGLDRTKRFVKCSEEDVHCGSLQCQYGEKIPQLSKIPLQFKVNKINYEGKAHECKAAPSAIEEGELHYGLVKDGTKCGYQRVCINRTCISLKTSASGRCPKDSTSHKPCSGHGVCTNINTCHCDEGWNGHDCSQTRDEGLTESTPESDDPIDLDHVGNGYTIVKASAMGSNLAITVVATSTIIGIALVICFTLLCLHRKSKLRSNYSDTYRSYK